MTTVPPAVIELLDSVGAINAAFLTRIRSLLDAPKVVSLAERYRVNQDKRAVDLGFNPFALVSEVYHRENFHSDILAAILDPKGAHGQSHLFLRQFISFLRDRHQPAIDPSKYSCAEVAPEEGRIDILIYDPQHGHAIIVENKINGAADMERQVIRYLELVEDAWKFTCDAIVYLSLDSLRRPDMNNWTDGERDRVTRLLKPVAVFHDAPDDLYHGWLQPCINSCANPVISQVIRHYADLVLKLGRNAMNKSMLEEFYRLMLVPERSQAVLTLQAMLAELPRYRATRILDCLAGRLYPFAKAWPYNNSSTVVIEGIESIKGWKRDSYLKVHVACEPAATIVSFWNNQDDPTQLPIRILADLGIRDWFPTVKNGWPSCVFRFPEDENQVIDFLLRFLSKLGEYERVPATA